MNPLWMMCKIPLIFKTKLNDKEFEFILKTLSMANDRNFKLNMS